MISKENRIKKRKDFRYIHKYGSPVFGKNIIIVYTDNKFGKIKIGLSVSKKVGKAYVRNKVKRQLRAIVRQNISTFVGAKNYVIVAKPSIVDLTFQQIEKELLNSMSKVKSVN